jgi:hypothetical protein
MRNDASAPERAAFDALDMTHHESQPRLRLHGAMAANWPVANDHGCAHGEALQQGVTLVD